MFAPICVLPRTIEVVALRHIGAGVRSNLAKFRGCKVNVTRVFVGRCQIHGRARETWIGSPLAVGDEGERKGIRVDFPCLLAVTYAAQALWQFGISSSGPLLVATAGHFLQSTIGVTQIAAALRPVAAGG